MTEKSAEKLDKVNRTLMGVENALLQRKVARQDATIDGALDTLNGLADDGVITFGDEEGDGGDAEGVPAQDGQDGQDGAGGDGGEESGE